jgi:hypothetical protein
VHGGKRGSQFREVRLKGSRILLPLVALLALLIAVTLLSADTPPEVLAKKLFDKAVADAETNYRATVVRCYKVLEGKLTPLIASAKKAGKDDRAADVQEMLDEAKETLTNIGVEVPAPPEAKPATEKKPATDKKPAVDAKPQTSSAPAVIYAAPPVPQGPEVVAKKLFDKALEDAEAARKAALVRAYKAFEPKITPLVDSATKAKKDDRARELQAMIDEAKKTLDELGVSEIPVTPGKGASLAQFQAVMNQFCIRCHPACRTVQQQVQKNWIVPGRPEQSKTYTCLGVNKRKGGTYHNVPDQTKKIVYDYIKAGCPGAQGGVPVAQN